MLVRAVTSPPGYHPHASRIPLSSSLELLDYCLFQEVKRDREYKRIKDIADIYALLWYSDITIVPLKADLLSIYPEEKARKTVRGFTAEETEESLPQSGEVPVKSEEC